MAVCAGGTAACAAIAAAAMVGNATPPVAFNQMLPRADAATVTLPDAKLYTAGAYSAYAAPFSADVDRTLRRGTDYYDTITIQPDQFPGNTLFDMRWPTRGRVPTGVWGFHALSYGNYGGGPVGTLIPSRQSGAIRELSADFDYAYAGSTNFNLLTEFFLTSRPGDANAKVSEIGFLLHVPRVTAAFMRRGEAIGDFTDAAGIAWRIWRVGTYFMVSRTDGVTTTRGTIDYAAVIKLLIAKRMIQPTSWFNGLAFGAEPTDGGGHTRLFVRRWTVRYS